MRLVPVLPRSIAGLPPHPQFPLAQPQLDAREREGDMGSRCPHPRQPQRDGPRLPRESPAARQYPDTQPRQSFFYCLKESRRHPWPRGHHMYRSGQAVGGGGCQGTPGVVHRAAAGWQRQAIWAPQKSFVSACTVPGRRARSCPTATAGTHRDPLPLQGSCCQPLRLPVQPSTAHPHVRVRVRLEEPVLAVSQTMLCRTPGSWGAWRCRGVPGGRWRQQTQCKKSATLCRKSWRQGCRYWKKRSMK